MSLAVTTMMMFASVVVSMVANIGVMLGANSSGIVMLIFLSFTHFYLLNCLYFIWNFSSIYRTESAISDTSKKMIAHGFCVCFPS